MNTAPLPLEHDFADKLVGLFEPWQAAPAPQPKLLLLNEPLAVELGLDPVVLRRDEGVSQLLGADLAAEARPVAQAYSGHQFGGLSPRLGDGRALLLGEIRADDGALWDVHLKGSGRTPFSRGGDGKAGLGPVLREYIMGEAMHGLGIPTTRALAALGTGEQVMREVVAPGAVLVRVASSHLRVGTFQYAALQGDDGLVGRLVEYALDRHYRAGRPDAGDDDIGALVLLDAVVAAQAELIAQWMLVGFIHGVMNTDNTTISGETIDYGPCAFMDTYAAGTVFSSIDHSGRYAYGNQPGIGQWNLARLAETLLPLIDPDQERSVELAMASLGRYVEQYDRAWERGMRSKLGLTVDPEGPPAQDLALFEDLLGLLASQRVDYTSSFRALADLLRGNEAGVDRWFADRAALDEWVVRWKERLDGDLAMVADGMDATNPLYIARNHLVEAALTAAVDDDDLEPVRLLVDVVSDPFVERPGLEDFAAPAPDDFGPYQTFCGT